MRKVLISSMFATEEQLAQTIAIENYFREKGFEVVSPRLQTFNQDNPHVNLILQEKFQQIMDFTNTLAKDPECLLVQNNTSYCDLGMTVERAMFSRNGKTNTIFVGLPKESSIIFGVCPFKIEGENFIYSHDMVPELLPEGAELFLGGELCLTQDFISSCKGVVIFTKDSFPRSINFTLLNETFTNKSELNTLLASIVVNSAKGKITCTEPLSTILNYKL